MNTIGWIGLGIGTVAAVILLKKNASAGRRTYRMILVPETSSVIASSMNQIENKADVQSVKRDGLNLVVVLRETGNESFSIGNRVWTDVPARLKEIDNA